ncbi:caspase family protein [Rhizobium leguminosarum]
MDGKYALAIGVRKSGKLPQLDGAIADARSFAEWAGAKGRDYTVKLVTDEDDAVTIDRLKGVIKTILEDDVSRLLVFYSGHGICSQAGDYWLLSDYDRDSDEAVNLSQSIRNARRLGIGQLAVFSDACRTSLNTVSLVSGRVIFPVPTGNVRLTSPYDEFLSTDIGDVSQEVPNEDPAKSYGVFSRCLLTALHGLEPDATEDRLRRKVISSVALANWLEKTVPLQSGKIPGGVVQYPSITPSWRAPNDEYAECISVADSEAILQGLGETGRRVLNWQAGGENLGLAERRRRRATAEARVAQGEIDRENTINKRSKAFQAQRGRESFETHQGLTVVGTRITDIVVPRGVKVDLFEEAGLWHVRAYGEPHAAALRTEKDLWLSATLLPEFIGTLVVGDKGIESLNYAPPRNSSKREENLQSEKFVAEWNALLSINRRATPLELSTFAKEARDLKHVNPAFGVLAAYAYERSGRIDQVASIAWYFAKRNNFVPWDIMDLLAGYGDPESMILAHGRLPNKIKIAGSSPMLTQGWAFLDPDSGARADLVALRPGLMDTVWTTFNSEAGRRFAEIISKGSI